jgi:uncharacterized protein (DUF1697 family)
MLKGVNVGGNPLKMDWLRAACEQLGLGSVQTYLQSGNIVLTSHLAAARVSGLLKEKIDAHTVRPVPVVVRSVKEMAAVVAANPFLGRKGVSLDKLHVTFLGDKPRAADTARLDKLAGRRDEYAISGREVYLHCPVNYGETKLSNAALEKVLGVSATTRNWATVTALLSMGGS